MAALGVARLNEAGANLVVTSLDEVAAIALSKAQLNQATFSESMWPGHPG
jgi:hypothetical protein